MISDLCKICLAPYSRAENEVEVDHIDWKLLVREGHAHNVIPMLFAGLNSLNDKQSVPPVFLKYIREEAKKIFAKNLRLQSELLSLAELLNKENINYIVYKGVMISKLFYQQIGLREFNDNDILINQQDLPVVRDLLLQRGYEPIIPLNEIGEKKILKFEKEFCFVKRKDGEILQEIDVHWMLLRPSFAMPITYARLMPDISILKVGESEVSTLSPECSFVILCIHHGVNEGWSKVKYLLDIHLAIEFINSADSWSEVMTIAQKLDVLRVVHTSLLITKRYLNSDIPDQILNKALNDPKAIELCEQHEFVKNESHWHVLKRKIALRDHTSKFRLVFNHFAELASPNYADQEFIKLPKPDKMFWMYYLIKPVRILLRGEKKSKFG